MKAGGHTRPSLNREDMRIVDEHGAITESAWELGHDYNHNRIDDIATTDASLSPPSYARSNKTMKTSAGGNPINFWLKRIAREDDMEGSKISLLKKDRKASNDRPDVTKSPMEEDGFGVQLSDEDSADSDVGHGGGSEDEGTDDDNKRRSSLSSLDEAVTSKPQSAPDGDVAVPVRKHTIEEPEEKPSAKKPKSAFPHAGPGDTRTMPRNGKRKQESMKHNASEGSLKSLGSRFTFGRNRKSPKRKLPAPKPARKSDFSVPFFGRVDDERLNAQMRNLNIQKNNKRKSVIALQRNARRVKYPGNAWLRYKNPQLWPSDLSAPDYASMTSGAEERPDFDSPFGSINSFATSVPSPRPLRFSHFSKRTHLESMCSSCMTSPGVHDDYTPASAFFMNASSSKIKDDAGNGVSMPFTEDLRRRLRVVSASSPASSKATSPLLMRTQLGSQPPPYSAQRSSFSETDDQLFTFSPAINITASGADTTLEAIGEATHAEIYKENASEANTAFSTEFEMPVSSPDNDADRNGLATNNIEVTVKRKRHKSVNRSTSCPLPAQCKSLSVAENHVDCKPPGTDVILNANNEITNAPVSKETMERSAMHRNSSSETLIDFDSPNNATHDEVALITETSFTKDHKNQDLFSSEAGDHACRKLNTDDSPLDISDTTSTADDLESAFTSHAAVVRDGVQPNLILAKPPLPSKSQVAYSKYAVSTENDSQIKCTDVAIDILPQNDGAVVIDIA